MGGRAGGGAGMGSRSRGSGGFDFAREAMGAGHPFFDDMRRKDFEMTMMTIDANIKDPQLKAEMKAVVEKMHKEMGGLPSGYIVKIESSKEFKKLGGSGYEFGRHGLNEIALNARYYGKGYNSVVKLNKQQMAIGKMTTVGKPAMKTFAHEFGHGYYDQLSSGGKAQIAKLFSEFSSSKSTKGWGSYAKKNPAEFYSDAVAKSVLGGSDKWTKALGKIR